MIGENMPFFLRQKIRNAIVLADREEERGV